MVDEKPQMHRIWTVDFTFAEIYHLACPKSIAIINSGIEHLSVYRVSRKL